MYAKIDVCHAVKRVLRYHERKIERGIARPLLAGNALKDLDKLDWHYDLAYLHLTEPFTPVADIPYAVAQVAKHFRPLYKGTLIINKGFSGETGNKVIEEDDADLVAFGVPFLANPDLVERIRKQAPLNAPDMATFYTPGPKGYVDYPTLA